MKPANGGEEYTIPATREITIRDLLRHTSGLTYQWNAELRPYYEKANVASGLLPYDGTIGDSVARLAKQPLLFNPGERWEYSLSVDVLGRLVEVVSGMPFDEFLRKRVFEPLGMKDTYFFVPDNKLDRLAAAYLLPRQRVAAFSRYAHCGGPLLVFRGLSLSRTKKALLWRRRTKFDSSGLRAVLPDDARRREARKYADPQPEIRGTDDSRSIRKDCAGPGVGLGFGIDGVKGPLAELGTPGSYSWGGFFYTAFSIDPKEDMIVVFMGQLHPTGDLELDRQVHELAYQAIND